MPTYFLNTQQPAQRSDKKKRIDEMIRILDSLGGQEEKPETGVAVGKYAEESSLLNSSDVKGVGSVPDAKNIESAKQKASDLTFKKEAIKESFPKANKEIEKAETEYQVQEIEKEYRDRVIADREKDIYSIEEETSLKEKRDEIYTDFSEGTITKQEKAKLITSIDNKMQSIKDKDSADKLAKALDFSGIPFKTPDEVIKYNNAVTSNNKKKQEELQKSYIIDDLATDYSDFIPDKYLPKTMKDDEDLVAILGNQSLVTLNKIYDEAQTSKERQDWVVSNSENIPDYLKTGADGEEAVDIKDDRDYQKVVSATVFNGNLKNVVNDDVVGTYPEVKGKFNDVLIDFNEGKITQETANDRIGTMVYEEFINGLQGEPKLDEDNNVVGSIVKYSPEKVRDILYKATPFLSETQEKDITKEIGTENKRRMEIITNNNRIATNVNTYIKGKYSEKINEYIQKQTNKLQPIVMADLIMASELEPEKFFRKALIEGMDKNNISPESFGKYLEELLSKKRN